MRSGMKTLRLESNLTTKRWQNVRADLQELAAGVAGVNGTLAKVRRLQRSAGWLLGGARWWRPGYPLQACRQSWVLRCWEELQVGFWGLPVGAAAGARLFAFSPARGTSKQPLGPKRLPCCSCASPAGCSARG